MRIARRDCRLAQSFSAGSAAGDEQTAGGLRVGQEVAEAVGKQAVAEGIAGVPDETSFEKELRNYIWEPVYLPYIRR